ncbi:MAG TPA: CehA/McbA family metallohydrolase [Vicinamibacteria bacterium]|nr:CehA/McbA family metallohydrolase [Vicinamibacteria bacterium]
MTRALAVALAVVGTAAVAPTQPPPPRREPVLGQVRVPHPYYWREMYVPQVTSGASAPSWSPDGREIVYARHGSLWRQALDGDVAQQITDGPGYDHQPDWSPDGQHVAYASYDGRAVHLRVLDLRTGTSTALLEDGAVHVDPRWSPDGKRLAWVSTAHEGRFHVFVADVVRDGTAIRLAAAQRITEDKDSGLPRYYYGRHDHYLSPSWSPDGREILLVSNRGRIHGTGGLWRMEARAGAPMRELHYEETTWKARPDWARDGRRVVYSSYHGRQWHQLWLTTAEGGDPFPLTYGDFDATSPRWSPDGRHIAYVSNESGDTWIVVVDVPGGRRRVVTYPAVGHQYLRPGGQVEIRTLDGATGAAVPARVSVRAADGRYFAPALAWRHSDEAFVRGEERFEYAYFHSPGVKAVMVPRGRAVIEAWKGPEYAIARQEVDVRELHTVVTLRLARLADLPAEGRWGGDLHVHMNYGGAYRNTPERLAGQARAEGLHLVENLVVNKEQRIPDIDAFRVEPDPVSTADFLLAHGQEFHTSVWGHMGLLGLREHYLLPDYAGYANTAVASLVPTNTEVARLARAQGGLVGYVHPFDTRPDPDDRAQPLAYAAPVDAALGTLDYFEVMGYSDHLVTSEFWYRLLNCGFRVPAGAGTDAFPNFASLRGPAGLLRTYAKAGPKLEHRAFLDALAAGKTFVTNAPLLWFEVEGHEPGGVIRMPAAGRVRARVRVLSNVTLDRVEVIGNGRVVASVPLIDAGTRAEQAVPLEVPASGWFVLRAYADRPRLPVLDLYPFASTSPVYVEVAGRPVRSPDDAAYFVRWVSRVEEAAAAHAAWNTPEEKAETLALLARARAEFERRR